MNAVDELIMVANVLRNTPGHGLDKLDGYTAVEIFRIVRACHASEWNITPADLRPDEIAHAAVRGMLSPGACARLRATLG